MRALRRSIRRVRPGRGATPRASVVAVEPIEPVIGDRHAQVAGVLGLDEPGGHPAPATGRPSASRIVRRRTSCGSSDQPMGLIGLIRPDQVDDPQPLPRPVGPDHPRREEVAQPDRRRDDRGGIGRPRPSSSCARIGTEPSRTAPAVRTTSASGTGLPSGATTEPVSAGALSTGPMSVAAVTNHLRQYQHLRLSRPRSPGCSTTSHGHPRTSHPDPSSYSRHRTDASGSRGTRGRPIGPGGAGLFEGRRTCETTLEITTGLSPFFSLMGH